MVSSVGTCSEAGRPSSGDSEPRTAFLRRFRAPGGLSPAIPSALLHRTIKQSAAFQNCSPEIYFKTALSEQQLFRIAYLYSSRGNGWGKKTLCNARRRSAIALTSGLGGGGRRRRRRRGEVHAAIAGGFEAGDFGSGYAPAIDKLCPEMGGNSYFTGDAYKCCSVPIGTDEPPLPKTLISIAVSGEDSLIRRRRRPVSEVIHHITNFIGSVNELWIFSPASGQAFSFGGRIVYSRTSAEAERATAEIFHKIEQLKHEADEEISFGFDMEWRPTFKKEHTLRKTAVLQICMDPSDCYIMHIIHSGVPSILKSLLKNPSFSKVGIGIRGDARKISRDYNVCVTPLVDLSKYANLKLGGAPKNWGLAALTEVLVCRQLLKPYKIRMGNWEAKELSEEQLHYAATDAFASWHLYQVLKAIPDPKPES
ncbi:Werner Syndrome-like exonuclease [Platanthera zijinensis]|uniref:3'-5' exonuclease n=1 Tax=Platanthera zijinensis TaxID=2320716 RepID=A0AAP0BCI3_9ASPA